MTKSEHIDKIYRVWSCRQEDNIAVRLRFSVENVEGCRVISVHEREEWA